MDSTFEHADLWKNTLPDELIFRYLRGLLSEKEKNDVEKQIAADPFLAESLEGWKQQLNAPHARHVYQNLKKSIHQRAYRRNYRRWMSMTYISSLTIAAVIATVVVITKIIEQRSPAKPPAEQTIFPSAQQNSPALFQGPLKNPTDTILSKYHITLVDTLLKQQLASDIPNTFSLRPALEVFETGRYDSAMILIDDVIHHEPANHLAWYYGAICQIALNHPVAATRMLLNPSLGEDSERHEAAMWYLGLVKLKIGDKGECINIMQLITQHGDIYVKQADALLKELQQ